MILNILFKFAFEHIERICVSDVFSLLDLLKRLGRKLRKRVVKHCQEARFVTRFRNQNEINSWTQFGLLSMYTVWVFIAQLGEHYSANTGEATGSNHVEAPKIFSFFLRATSQLLNHHADTGLGSGSLYLQNT